MLATVTSQKTLVICNFSSALIEISGFVQLSFKMLTLYLRIKVWAGFIFSFVQVFVVYMPWLEIQCEDRKVEKK